MRTLLFARVVGAALSAVVLVSCTAGGGGEPVTGIEPASSFDQDSNAESPSAPESDAAIDAPSDAFDDPDAAFSISAVAGFESGLQRVAHIGGTIAAGKRDEVMIQWSGSPVPNSSAIPGLLYDCDVGTDNDDCDVYATVTYDEPGVYPFTVTYNPAGLDRAETLTGGNVIVTPPSDFVIVSIGDSVASGEGNPVKKLVRGDGGYWNDFVSNRCPVWKRILGFDCIIEGQDIGFNRCHRTAISGPALAANRLQGNPKNDLTFVHIACSGGLFRPVAAGDLESNWYAVGSIGTIDLQLRWVRERIPDGKIDVLLLSGGANNIGFGTLILDCIGGQGVCDSDDQERNSARVALRKKFRGDPDADPPQEPELTPSYRALQDLLLDDQYRYPSVVAITEYFDPTHDKNGEFPEARSCLDLSISRADWEYLYEEVVQPLNNAVYEAASTHGWVHVGGIQEAFRAHGYCAEDQAWVVTAPESLNDQRDPAGAAHPNEIGQQIYANAIYDAIVQNNPPRTAASATTARMPYTFGTWVNTDVIVTLEAHNPIDESGVQGTHYAIDDPRCVADSILAGVCTAYSGPITVSQSGSHVVSFLSISSYGAVEKNVDPVVVMIDKDPPEMTCTAAPAEAWPPNRRLVDIDVAVTAVDAVSGPADYVLTAVSDSYGEESSAIEGFEVGTADTAGRVLSDRAGNRGARTYTLTYQSEDHVGNVGTCDVVITVPHDQRP